MDDILDEVPEQIALLPEDDMDASILKSCE